MVGLMKKKGEVKVIINYPKDKEELDKGEKIKIKGAIEIILRSKNIDEIDEI